MSNPTQTFNFISGVLDPRITFVRSGATATRVNASGLIENVPANTARFDYDPVTLAPKGLLVEESRTNLALNSAVITAGAGTTVSPDAAASPDGTLSADLIIETVITGEHYAGDRAISVTAGSTYTWSVFVKDAPSANRSLYLRVAGGANLTLVFNPRTKTISNTGGPGYLSSEFQELPSGWFRVAMAFTAQTTTTLVCRLQFFTTTSVYTGDGTSGLYLWGAQLEPGSFATSYMPTGATAMTRNADVATITGTNFSNFWDASKGGAQVQAIASTVSGIRPLVQYDDGTANEIIALRGNTTNPELYIVDGGTPQAQLDAGTIVANTAYSLTGWWAANDCKARKDLGAVVTDTTATIPAVTQARIGSDGTNYLNGTIATIEYYAAFSSQIYTRRKNKVIFNLM